MTDILISKAPDDAKEKEAWAETMASLQISMWIDGKSHCEQCGHVYTSTQDFKERNPKRGYGEDMDFVDNDCWDAYLKMMEDAKN